MIWWIFVQLNEKFEAKIVIRAKLEDDILINEGKVWMYINMIFTISVIYFYQQILVI